MDNEYFTPIEELFLVHSVDRKFKNIIESMQIHALSDEQEGKVWEEVRQAFEIVFSVKRSASSLKWKYGFIKRMARKSLHYENRQLSMVVNNETNEMMVSVLDKIAASLQNEMAENNSEIQDILRTEEVPVDVPNNQFTEESYNIIEVLNAVNEDVTEPAPSSNSELEQTQRAFYMAEERRAEERHSWEREKHEWNEEQWMLQKDILRYELEIMKREIEYMDTLP